ncbi:hypothetical protein [Nostoc sp. FACHB-892]|nr:hypothetical protein [Nostoc sp. FACHB-892]
MISYLSGKPEFTIDLPKKLLYVFQVLNMRSLSKVNLFGERSHE